MTPEQNALKVFEEELGEFAMELGKLQLHLLKIQQRVSKAERFDINACDYLPQSNKELIEAEWNDLLGSIQYLAQHGINLQPDLDTVAKKVDKITRYAKKSKEIGAITN